ncbi:hypothetical protein SAMN05216184_101251 [Georgenia satyanarayanai]|uniref:Uncharacterized protein n=1 Tax=Georgenia satyanarayanai TaxID=860221 RepID=A0A2Y9A350_9MICO|nr:hypothetical protein [Georgenia satyanarayanai]PYG01787.1 hypothetical protein A8987_101251 [Georgenia satyanarayanai]SSA36587.1 hypothetical protein SAMN05216184_101251 [Georgenia satyanarayanai]
MDEVQQEKPAVAVGVVDTPPPCANYLVGGISVLLVGVGILVYGLAMYLGVDETTGNVGAVVLGAIVTVTGVSLLLAGVSRAAVALDYLVDSRRPTSPLHGLDALTTEG